MTVDIGMNHADEALLEDLDEVMEDSMVQLFVLQPRTEEALKEARKQAREYEAIFYVAPMVMKDETDENCVGFLVRDPKELSDADKPVFVEEKDLGGELSEALVRGGYEGIVLNASKPHEDLPGFLVALGEGGIDRFDPEALNQFDMDRIVLQSGYPEYDLSGIYRTVKVISDAMFRPEQSIIARATKNSLTLLGFKR